MTNDIIKNKNWKALEEKYDWVRDMNLVKQHQLYHKEGTVAVHTQLVLDELVSIEGFSDLSDSQQEILWVAALLHDVEKRSTSVDYGNGRISARGHAEKGEYTARAVLYKDFSVSFAVREQIASLVALHALPLLYLDQASPTRSLIAASLRVEMRMLKILSEADVRGRRCLDPEPLIESLYQFRSFCLSNNCWTKPFLFRNDYSRFCYFHCTEDELVDQNVDLSKPKFKCKVTLMSALPRMGRAEYIQSLNSALPVVSYIEYSKSVSDDEDDADSRLKKAKKEALMYIDQGQDFIWNSANIRRTTREPLIQFLVENGAEVEIIYLEKPYAEWMRLNKQSANPLSEIEIESLLHSFDIPLLTEAHNVDYIVY